MDKVKPKKIRKKVKSEDSVALKGKKVSTKKTSVSSKEKKNTVSSKEKKNTVSPKVKIRKRRIKIDVSNKPIYEEQDNLTFQKLEDEAIKQEELSIGVIALILFVCLVVGIGCGYLLYRLAINSSATIIFRIF